jgi:cell division protein ZapA
MAGRTVQLRVGGQTYRVVTSASDDELQRLAAVVDAKLATVVPAGRAVTPQAMLLAAMALAHELEEERSRSAAVATKARGAFGRLLQRVDAAIEATAEGTVSRTTIPVPAPSTPLNDVRFAPKPPSDGG